MSKRLPYWEILGLEEAPKDRKTLKRAYAKRLKVTRPEDDPEGFMLLRDAHDIGLQNIAYLQSLDAEEHLIDDPIHVQDSAVETSLKSENINADKDASISLDDMIPEPDVKDTFSPHPVTIESDVENVDQGDFAEEVLLEEQKFPLQDDLATLLNDAEKRYERDPWAAIFKRAHALDIDDFTDFENGLLGLLLEKSGYYQHNHDDGKSKPITSQSIAASIFATLNWDEAQMANSYKAEGIAWLKQKLVKPKYPQSQDGVYVPETAGNFWTENIWWMVGLLFLGIQFFRFLVNQG